MSLRSDDQREALVAMRDALASAIEVAEPKEVAALVRQLVAVSDKLAAMKPPEVSRRDELAAARAERLAGADAAGRATRGRVKRSR